MRLLTEVAPLAVWSLLWASGGWLLTGALFRLRRTETPLVGVGIGLVLEVWLANLTVHFLPVPLALWIAAGTILAGGLAASWAFRAKPDFRLSSLQWIAFGLTTLLLYSIGRGLGIFDDYQNLPTVSLMATGDIPPHFALNPSLSFGYHYFLLLFCAELMRLGGLFPWSALDLGRAVILALPLLLAGLFGRRITRSRLAGFLTILTLLFAGGTRWLLLLLPTGWLAAISNHVTLIGSAATTASSLMQALLTNWKIDGAGPIPFPFAFYTGVNQPYVMAYTGIAGSGVLILLLLLLTSNRWRHWSASIVTLALFSSLAIANEIAFLLLGFGFGITLVAWLFKRSRRGLSRGLLQWTAIAVGGLVLAVVQGGLLSDMVGARLAESRLTPAYFDASPAFVWPPAIVSAHLGSLSLLNPSQLLAALAEIGPIVLVTPLLGIWAWKCIRSGRWLESSLISASWGAILALFIAFKGPLFTATPRLMSGWFFACILYFVPLSWIWLRRRRDWMASAVIIIGGASCFGGLVLFAVQLAAVQKPVYATFITPMDARMSRDYWNRLEPGYWILDPVVYRAPTVFGRFTDSSPSWYTRTDAWQALIDAPDPYRARAQGFGYMYFDSDFWNGLSVAQQQALAVPCVHQIAQVDGIHSEKDYSKDFRRLLDIRACH